jgi:Flp pilus assembly protein TadB
MSPGAIVAIIVVVVILAVAGFAAATARRRRLKKRFGPEYERVVTDQQSQRKAEAELATRERRVRSLDIRSLSGPASRSASSTTRQLRCRRRSSW